MTKLATPFAGALRRLLCVLSLLVPMSSALADEFPINSGLSAHWFNPERSGEGLVLEILSDEAALLYWFTYDAQGNQRWLIDVGEIVGAEIVFPELTVTRGGRFGPEFDPDEVEYEVVGEAVLRFSDCDHAEFSYSAFDQAETVGMQRLSQTMAAGCQPVQGIPGEPVKEYAGQSGSWYDPANAGEGYTLQWMSRDEAVLIWFSYDPDGNQYWMLGTGHHENGKIKFPALHSTKGGRFGGEFNPSDVELIEWGSLSLELDCGGGIAHYESSVSGFESGSLSLDRLTEMSQVSCPWTPPKLQDLYDIELIPVSDTEVSTHAADINNEGIMIAVHSVSGGAGAAMRGLEEEDWELLNGPDISGNRPRLSPDGMSMVAGTVDLGDSGASFRTVLWNQDSGWQDLSNTVFDGSIYGAASLDLTKVVGIGAFDGDPKRYPWIWSEGEGQMEIPLTEDIRSFTPSGVANDGNVIIGKTVQPWSGGPVAHRDVAVRWDTLEGLQIMHDTLDYKLGAATTCNVDCSIVAGMEQADYDPNHPNFREAWLWRDDGRMTYLGQPADAIQDARIPPATPLSISADGSIVVGSYLVLNPGNSLGSRGFVWTQSTGMVSVRDLIEDLDLGDDDWLHMDAMSISPDGSKVLLSGFFRASTFAPTRYRTFVLKLATE